MFEKQSSNLNLAIQKAVAQARDTNFFQTGVTGRGGLPVYQSFEADGDLMLVTELPGIKKEELTLEVREDVLRLTGLREIKYGEDCSCHRLERKGLCFDRSLKLPFRIETDKIRAEFKDGLLQVFLPRAESDKPKKIVIN